MIQGILLDIDGTLLNSNEAHAQSWLEVFKAHQIEASFDEILKSIGMGGDKLLRKFAKIEKESELGKKLSHERGELFKSEFLPRLQAFPQTRKFIEELLRRKFKLVVATSASKKELPLLLKQAQIDDLLNQATSSDDAEKSKPDPDIIEAALQLMDLPTNQVVMLGDTPYDIEAARRAGVNTIALRSGGWTEPDLKGALEIYQDVSDLLNQLDHSALAR